MSRTYRKNTRYYRNFRGDLYSMSRSDRTVKNKADRIEKYNWDNRLGVIPRSPDSPYNGGCVKKVVLVGDSGNYHRSAGDWKRIAHKRNRSRCRAAIFKNPEDVHFTNAINPWDWD